MLEIANKSLASANALAEHHPHSQAGQKQGKDKKGEEAGRDAGRRAAKGRRRDGAEGRGGAVAPPPRALGAWLPQDVPVTEPSVKTAAGPGPSPATQCQDQCAPGIEPC